jgi:hypothetical protein
MTSLPARTRSGSAASRARAAVAVTRALGVRSGMRLPRTAAGALAGP